jgi:hypothetical protein
MRASAVRQKIAVRIPRRIPEEAPKPKFRPEPAPVPHVALRCGTCGAGVPHGSGLEGGAARAPDESGQSAAAWRVRLFLVKQHGSMAWEARASCPLHSSSAPDVVSGKLLCSACGKIISRGKKQPVSGGIPLQWSLGAVALSARFCCEACRAARSSCARKTCWTCGVRDYGLGEVMQEAKQGKISKPEEAIASLRKITLCGGCHLAAYCSADCQKTDWAAHKQQCQKLSGAADLARHLATFGPRVCPFVFQLL